MQERSCTKPATPRTTSTSSSKEEPRSSAATPRPRPIIAVIPRGGFLGELSLLTGQRPYLTGRVTESGRVLRIRRDEFRRLMSAKPDIADLIFNAFSARRERLREGDGARAIRIVGSRYSSDAMALRAFATRSHLPHAWIDLEEAPTTPRSSWPAWDYARSTCRR